MFTSGNNWPRTKAEPPVPVPTSRIFCTFSTGFSSKYNFLSLHKNKKNIYVNITYRQVSSQLKSMYIDTRGLARFLDCRAHLTSQSTNH